MSAETWNYRLLLNYCGKDDFIHCWLILFVSGPPPGQTGRPRHYVLNLSVRPLPNLWTRCFENEWTDFGTSGPRVKAVKRATLGSGGQRSRSYGAEIGHKNHFWRNISRTSRQILTNPSSHSSLDDQRLKVEVTRGLAEASFGSSSVSSFYLFRSS